MYRRRKVGAVQWPFFSRLGSIVFLLLLVPIGGPVHGQEGKAAEEVLAIAPHVWAAYENEYLRKKRPAAFAVSADGMTYGYSYCPEYRCKLVPSAQAVALNSCQRSGGKDCRILAVGHEIKIAYRIVEPTSRAVENPMSWTRLEPDHQELWVPRERIAIKVSTVRDFDDSYCEYYGFEEGYIVYCRNKAGGYWEEVDTREFQAVFEGTRVFGAPIPYNELQPHFADGFQTAEFRHKGRTCAAFLRVLGDIEVNKGRRGAPRFFKGIYCGTERSGGELLRWLRPFLKQIRAAQ